MNWFELLIAFMFTWGLGLSPALVARYIIFKKPIKFSTAIWIAGVSCFIFFWAFRFLNAWVEPGSRSTGLVWVMVFFVSNWVMGRGYSKQLLKKIEDRLKGSDLSLDERSSLQEALKRIKK